MSNKKHSLGSIIALVVSGIIIVFSIWVFLNRQLVLDLLSVWSFHPGTEVATIEQRTGMTDNGRFIFYATKPQVLSSEDFNKECPRQEVGNPILGCYNANDRIFIYNLADDQLDGMKEVTAAHEMLHAVWQRTSESEKARIGSMISAAYQKIDNAELKTRMDYYQRTEPGEFTNELHSILGTEVQDLGADLENYYSQFFDRTDVLALHDKYDNFYTGLSTQAEDLYGKMQELGVSIDSRSATYNQNASQLSADITSFNARANGGQFKSSSQFYSERAALVKRSNQLEKDHDSINADIETYNTYYGQYQEIASQIQVLNNSMDSYGSLAEAPSV